MVSAYGLKNVAEIAALNNFWLLAITRHHYFSCQYFLWYMKVINIRLYKITYKEFFLDKMIYLTLANFSLFLLSFIKMYWYHFFTLSPLCSYRVHSGYILCLVVHTCTLCALLQCSEATKNTCQGKKGKLSSWEKRVPACMLYVWVSRSEHYGLKFPFWLQLRLFNLLFEISNK